MKIYESLRDVRTKARKVENPPWKTGAPILINASFARPEKDKRTQLATFLQLWSGMHLLFRVVSFEQMYATPMCET